MCGLGPEPAMTIHPLSVYHSPEHTATCYHHTMRVCEGRRETTAYITAPIASVMMVSCLSQLPAHQLASFPYLSPQPLLLLNAPVTSGHVTRALCICFGKKMRRNEGGEWQNTQIWCFRQYGLVSMQTNCVLWLEPLVSGLNITHLTPHWPVYS